MPVSFQIAIMAGVIAVLIAIPLGTISALYRDTWIDHTVRVVAVSGLAIPSFWLGMLIILALLSLFNWLPKIGYVPLWQDPITNLSVTIWPAASVGYRYAAVATRMMRSSLLEVMREDYIRTARAKGVWTRLIMSRHALRNALLPVVTVIGLEFAFLIGGLVVTEQVFNINGIGKLFVDATARGDFNLIQGLVLLIATIFVLRQPARGPALWLARSAHPPDLRARAHGNRRNHTLGQIETHSRAAQRALGSSPRRQPLGLVGLPDHPASTWCARSGARWISPFDPEAIDFAAMLSRPGARALVRHRPVRPRRVLAHRLRLAHGAGGRHPLGRGRLHAGARWSARPPAISAAASTTPSSAWSTSCCRSPSSCWPWWWWRCWASARCSASTST